MPVQMFIYIDESGDFGIRKGSRYFVIACLLINNSSEATENLAKARNRTKSELGLVLKQEVKFNKLPSRCRRIFLDQIGRHHCRFFIAFTDTHAIPNKFLDKLDSEFSKIMPDQLRASVHCLFVHAVLEQLLQKVKDRKITIIADRDLPIYRQKEIKDAAKEVCRKYNRKLKVRYKNSKSYEGIQMADLIAGAYHAHLKGRGEFYKHIANPLLEMPIIIGENGVSLTYKINNKNRSGVPT